MKKLTGPLHEPYWIIANWDQVQLHPSLKRENWQPVTPEYFLPRDMNSVLKKMQLNRVRLWVDAEPNSYCHGQFVLRTLQDLACYSLSNLPDKWATISVVAASELRKKMYA